MKIFVAGGTGTIGRPLIARLLAKGHDIVALTRSAENTHALVEQGVEPAIADVFDPDAVKAVVTRAEPEVVIEQLTALPKTYTREAMRAAAPFNSRIRLEGGANVLAAAQAAGVRRYVRQSIAFWAAPGPGLADEETPLAFGGLLRHSDARRIKCQSKARTEFSAATVGVDRRHRYGPCQLTM